MKQPNAFLRLAALVSSVLLASGFVAYSAGAFGWLGGDRPVPAESNISPNIGREMFPGSKSDMLIDPAVSPAAETVNAAPPVKGERPSAFFGGSKTISVSPLVPPPPAPASEPVAAEPAQSVMLGSKSPAVRPLISPQPTGTSKMPTKQPQSPQDSNR